MPRVGQRGHLPLWLHFDILGTSKVTCGIGSQQALAIVPQELVDIPNCNLSYHRTYYRMCILNTVCSYLRSYEEAKYETSHTMCRERLTVYWRIRTLMVGNHELRSKSINDELHYDCNTNACAILSQLADTIKPGKASETNPDAIRHLCHVYRMCHLIRYWVRLYTEWNVFSHFVCNRYQSVRSCSETPIWRAIIDMYHVSWHPLWFRTERTHWWAALQRGQMVALPHSSLSNWAIDNSNDSWSTR